MHDGDSRTMAADMSIEEAIEYGKTWKQVFETCAEKPSTSPGIKCLDTLINVAEAWLKMEEWVKSRTEYQGISIPTVRAKMYDLINPTPKTDLQRVREWANQYVVPSPGRYHCYEGPDLVALINQIEAEKENPSDRPR